jgi:hypothetical protein
MSTRISLRVLLFLTQLMGILELRGQAPPASRLDDVSVLPFPAASEGKGVRFFDGRPGPLLTLDSAAPNQGAILSPMVWPAQGDVTYLARDENRQLRLELAMTDFKSLPSDLNFATGLHDQLERTARKQAVEEARVKAARLAEEAEMKARQSF